MDHLKGDHVARREKLIRAKFGYPKCVDYRNVKVLSQEEWKRLNEQVDGDKRELKRIEEKRKANEEIRNKSQEMVKNWTNTFLGAQQKKLDDRAKRLAKEEEAKVAIDLEEAKYQAQQRKAAIDEAKLKIYYQTDRVKTFHSALKLTEVLKEREAQLEFKDLCKKLNQNKDKMYVEQYKKELEEATLKEQQKVEERRAKNLENADFLKEQMQLREEEKRKQREESLAEGEQLRRQVIEDQLERERLEQLYKEQADKLLKDYQNQINGQHQMKEIERLKEEEEDEKCRLFAAAKNKMLQLRALREREMFQEREEQLEKIRSFLAEKITVAQRDEDEQIRKAVAEREAAELKREQEKAKKLAETLVEIESHRLSQIQQKRKDMEAEKMAELEEVRVRAAAERAIAEYEAACSEARMKKYKQLSEEYLAQQRERQETKKANRELEIKSTRTGNRLSQLEEELFQDYTRRVIDHCKANGRNTYPLEVAAKPSSSIGLSSALPGETSVVDATKAQGDETNQNNNAVENGDKRSGTHTTTNNRMGFVW